MANTDGERAEGPCVSPSVYHKSRQENRKNYVMTKSTPTPYAYAKRTARRVAATPARRSHPVGPSRTPQAHACRLLEDPRLAISCAHGTNARRLHRAPATDSRRPADPTSRMGRAKWRILHAPLGTARHFDAKGTQRVYRCSSARPRTGTK